jgi:hypothetical protein
MQPWARLNVGTSRNLATSRPLGLNRRTSPSYSASPRDARIERNADSTSSQRVSTRRPRGPSLCSAMRPHEPRLLALCDSRILMPILRDFSRRGPEGFVPPVFHSPTLLWPTLSSSCRDIAFSQSRDPRAQILGSFLTRSRYTIPRVDPTVLLRSGSNGYPPSRTS